MNTAPPSSIIQRIQSLLALSRSENVNEAATAAAMAEAMIAKYRLTMADVRAGAGQSADQAGEGEPLMTGARFDVWRVCLGTAIGHHYGCFVVTDGREKGNQSLRIIGLASDVELTRYMFAWIASEVVRLAAPEKGRRAKNSFVTGAVEAITAALKAAKKQAEEAHTVAHDGSAAIELASRANAAKQWCNKHIGGSHDSRPRVRFDQQARERGIVAGSGIHLGQSLPGGPRALPAAS